MKNLFSKWRSDAPASLVVFLVALPLCLGIALASTGESPILFSGIISGVIGGIVVGSFSGSKLGVSGPAAGLITIVLAALITLGNFESFLVAVILAGILQIIAGFVGAGVIGNYFPSSVIKGMLAAIGLTLILKEIPHLVGYANDFMGNDVFVFNSNKGFFKEIVEIIGAIHWGAIIISVVSLMILILFDRPFMKKIALFKFIPGALIVVILGTLLNVFFNMYIPNLNLAGKHLVDLPVTNSFSDFKNLFVFPDFSALTNPNVYGIAFTIALVASLESLLSVEATDKLDPAKQATPTNRELKAQGIGNVISGLLGGLPITQVIVRSSANINAGGKSKLSTILHGFLLFLSVLLLPSILNMIPYASLAAILMMVGYKLSSASLYKKMFALGWAQFLPFIATIVGVLFTDLLKGIGIGLVFAIFFILRKNYRNNYRIEKSFEEGRPIITLKLSEEVTFLNKGSILESLYKIPQNTNLIIDGSNSRSIDYDVLEVIQEFRSFTAKERNIKITTFRIPKVAIMGH
ncbi:MAG: SulP family inorganic anion transporter [Crocinitomicaceae bacterium]|nr:SulP family inorganic anion transporter [Crocinitomicaceae bacterium]